MWSESAPFLITAVIAFLGAVPCLFLPETADIKMPDTLEDMAEFGRHDRLFWMPLCRNKRRFKESNKVNETSPMACDNKGFY